MSKHDYIHGYSEEEQERLLTQNETLADFIYDRLDFSKTKRLLEVGVGVGAQMIRLLQQYPDLHITGLDISTPQIEKARHNLENAGISAERYRLLHADARKTGFTETLNVDTVLLIWVLEHVSQPQSLLQELVRILPSGATIYLTEVFHNSLNLYPSSPAIRQFWKQTLDFQSSVGGDANIGLRLGSLMHDVGFKDIHLSPYPMHFDKRHPDLRWRLLSYWKNLTHSALETLKKHGFSSDEEWEQVEQDFDDLLKNPDAVFYYSFVQASAVVP